MQQNKNEQTEKKLGFFGKLAKSFIDNPLITVLTTVFIVIVGVGSYITIPKAYNPEIIAPAYAVITEFPGATADQVYQLVTRPTENALNELPRVDKVVSQSFDGGKSVVTVQFEVGTSMNSTKTVLNQKLQDNASQRPIGAKDPTVTSMDSDDVPIINVALTSDKYSETALRSMAHDVSEQLKLINNASKITVVGGRTNNLQIDLDAQKLAQNHLTPADVASTVKASSGVYSVEPLSGSDNIETLRINGSVASVEDAENILLVADQDHPLKLGDVSKIYEGPGQITSGVNFATKEKGQQNVAYVNVAKIKGSNVTTVAADVNTKIAEIQKKPEYSSVKFTVTRDDGQTAGEEVGVIMKHLVVSTLIVVAVLLLLLSLKDALNVALSIPLTLMVTFGLALAAGQTVNRVALFGIIVALGLMVDNAIVVIENIHRMTKSNPGKSRASIIAEAANEVGMGVFMSTLTVVASFMPMYLVSGMMGAYIRPIPFFVSVSMIVSLILAFTINPALSMKLSSESSHESENFFQRAVRHLTVRYAKFLRSALEDAKKGKRIVISVFALCIVAISLPFFKVVKINLIPKSDAKQFYIYLDMPSGTSYGRTNEVATQVQEAVLASQEVSGVESFVGTPPISEFNGLFKGSFARVGENQATLKVDLIPKEERENVSGKIVQQTRESVGEQLLAKEPDAKLVFVEDPAGPPVRSAYYLKIQGDDQQLRESTTRDLEQLSGTISGVSDLNNSISKRSLEKQYHVDFEKTARLGIAPAAVIDTLHTSLSGTNIALYNAQTNNVQNDKQQHFITVRMQADDRSSEVDLSQISVRSGVGESVPISQLLVEDSPANEISVSSDQRQRTTYVTGEMGKGQSIIYAITDLFPKLFHYHLSDGTGIIVSWSPMGVVYQNSAGQRVNVFIDGEWKQTLETFRDIGMVGAVTIVLIYLMLLIQTKSAKIPILVMATIPLGLIGVFFGFGLLYAINGTYFSAMAALGIIALTGIVVKNAILFLAYLDELKVKDISLVDALVESGSVRLLPILLTSLVAILGSFTIVSDATWQGLAWSLIFGLSVSTSLTMIIFPLLYFRFERKSWEQKEKN